MKKLNLLRKLDNPKVGDIVIGVTEDYTYKIEAIIGDQLCVSTTSSGGEVKAYLTSGYCLRQIPLLWLEYTPIYEGDVLYAKESGQSGKIICSGDTRSFCVLDIVESIDKPTHTAYFHNELTLTKPKVKVEIAADILIDGPVLGVTVPSLSVLDLPDGHVADANFRSNSVKRSAVGEKFFAKINLFCREFLAARYTAAVSKIGHHVKPLEIRDWFPRFHVYSGNGHYCIY